MTIERLHDARPFSAFIYGHSFVTSTAVDGTPELIMRGRGIQWRNYGLAGSITAQLISRAAGKVHPYGPLSPASILIIIAGINDYNNAVTGATCTTNHTTLATDAKAAGFDWVIACTAPASIDVTGGEETQRGLGNTALLAADTPGGAGIDYTVDLAADAVLAADILAGDGTHPSSIVGRQRIADLIAVPLDLITA